MSLTRLIRSILYIGVNQRLPFEETRKIKALNFAILISCPFQLLFCILNSVNGYYLLALFNGTMALLNLVTMALQYYHRFKTARTLYIAGVMLFFTFTPILFHNSGEYMLILNIAAILLFFDHTSIYILLVLLDMACFVFVKISFRFFTPSLHLPPYRNIASLSAFFLFLTLTLLYYRRQQMHYQRRLERRNAELNQRSENLENLNRSKEKIFSILSHDLRQPLISVKSLLFLMNKNAISASALLEMSDKINNNLDHIILSLDNTLNWSLNQLNGIRTHPENFDLYEIAGNVYELLQGNIQGKNLVYIDNIHVSAKVFADKEQVAIILRNLLSNAIKFTHPGGLIHLFAKEGPSHWQLHIEDSGIGMDEATVGKLFDAGEHFTRRGTANEKGTGLGLKLIKELIQMNEGDISVKSIQGKGTIFSVHLKKAVDSVAPVPLTTPALTDHTPLLQTNASS